MGEIDSRIQKIKEEYQKKNDVLKSENAILREQNTTMNTRLVRLYEEAEKISQHPEFKDKDRRCRCKDCPLYLEFKGETDGPV